MLRSAVKLHSVDSAAAHSDQVEVSQLCHALVAAKNGSVAVKQLLGPLLATTPSQIPVTVTSLISAKPKDKSLHPNINSVIRIGRDGRVLTRSITTALSELWPALTEAQLSESDASSICGRITQCCSPTSAVVLLLLACQEPHFKIPHLLSTFTSRGTSSGVCPHSKLGSANRTWSFTIKYYYTRLGQEDDYLGQRSGIFHETEPEYYIRSGSSTVALCLSGTPGLQHSAKSDERPLDKWRILLLSCDDEPLEMIPNLTIGMEAYLWCINNEIATARRRLRVVAEKISRVATPQDDILFDSSLRDTLLFEDSSYSRSRTYFWALQSLRIVNECIQSLVLAWELYDKTTIVELVGDDENASQPAGPQLPASKAWTYLQEIGQQMQKLRLMVTENNARQEEIKSLRDGLFNASAVLEARTTVGQGQNVRILTLVSMLFLPASFSTSIFGMQSILPLSTSLQTFALVMCLVCGITYALILGVELSRNPSIANRSISQLAQGLRHRFIQASSRLFKRRSRFADVEAGRPKAGVKSM